MGTIYKLNFADNTFYIGQTLQQVHERVKQHQYTKGKGCPLLQHAFDTSEFIGYNILEENILSKDMDAKEVQYIKELNPPLNTLPGGKSISGLNHPRSKYSKEQLQEVMDVFLNSTITYRQIADLTEVGYSTVMDIVNCRAHAWVWENIDPKLIQEAKSARKRACRLYDSNNTLYEADTIAELAGLLDMPIHAIVSALNGAKSAKGLSTTQHPVVKLVSPLLEELTLTLPQAVKHLTTHDNLSRYQLNQLTQKFKASGGWQISILESQ